MTGQYIGSRSGRAHQARQLRSSTDVNPQHRKRHLVTTTNIVKDVREKQISRYEE